MRGHDDATIDATSRIIESSLSILTTFQQEEPGFPVPSYLVYYTTNRRSMQKVGNPKNESHSIL